MMLKTSFEVPSLMLVFKGSHFSSNGLTMSSEMPVLNKPEPYTSTWGVGEEGSCSGPAGTHGKDPHRWSHVRSHVADEWATPPAVKNGTRFRRLLAELLADRSSRSSRRSREARTPDSEASYPRWWYNGTPLQLRESLPQPEGPPAARVAEEDGSCAAGERGPDWGGEVL